MIKIYLLSIVFFLIVNVCDAKNIRMTELAQLHKDYCADVPIKLNENSAYFLAMQPMLKNEKNTLDQLNAKFISGINGLSEQDRIIFAELLMASKSVDFEKIKRLLSFTSKDIIIENYRKYSEGFLDITLGASHQGFEKISYAIENLPFVDVRLLLDFFGISLNNQLATKEKLKPFLEMIKKVPDSDTLKINLLAFENYILSPSYDVHTMTEFSRQAYLACKTDESVALGYAITLYLDEKDFEQSKEILNNIIKKESFYSPLVDLYLARIYLEKKEVAAFTKHFHLAKSAASYLGPKDREILDGLKLSIDESSDEKPELNSFFLKYGLVFVVLGLMLVVLVKGRKKS